ncbi:hypothetical protein [Thermus thermophilus]|uniref:hypothetical protein n=1 Tax=Thermus thermophilus TaxID=274 RepID=UPI0012FD19A0|nr:hypothetical protein [Thermus thermophilus]
MNRTPLSKALILAGGLLALAACAPYQPGPWPRPLGPKGLEHFLELLLSLLLLGLLVLATVWLLGQIRRGGGRAEVFPPLRPRSLLVPRLTALREQAASLPREKGERVMALVVEAWEAWGRGEVERAEALTARAEALLDLLRDQA